MRKIETQTESTPLALRFFYSRNPKPLALRAVVHGERQCLDQVHLDTRYPPEVYCWNPRNWPGWAVRARARNRKMLAHYRGILRRMPDMSNIIYCNSAD